MLSCFRFISHSEREVAGDMPLLLPCSFTIISYIIIEHKGAYG